MARSTTANFESEKYSDEQQDWWKEMHTLGQMHGGEARSQVKRFGSDRRKTLYNGR